MIAALGLLAGGAAAGLFGSLLGLGGGILLVPLLTLGFGRPLREAVAVSLVSVIVTSSASASVYLQRHVANLRLGMVLEVFTAGGALVGGLVAFLLPTAVLQALFAILLAWVAVSMLRRQEQRGPAPVAIEDVLAGAADTTPPRDMAGSDDGPDSTVGAIAARVPVDAPHPGLAASLSGEGYTVARLPFGMAGAVGAGIVSALLGVGGGIIKVPVMHLVMGVPLKVSTATSNMMIGVTATSSAVIYLLRDQINPYVAGPVAVGVFLGASFGARIIHRVDVGLLRWLFVVVLLVTAVQMAFKAFGL
jgi:uncharacterized membrane protein YfcA